MPRYVVQSVTENPTLGMELSSREDWEDVVSTIVKGNETKKTLLEHNMKDVKKQVEKYGSGLLNICEILGHYDPYNANIECLVITDTQFKFPENKTETIFLKELAR